MKSAIHIFNQISTLGLILKILDPTTQPINIKTHAIDIAIASPLVILDVVISLFSGVGRITFLEYKLGIFLKLPDVKFGVTSGIVMLTDKLFDRFVDRLVVELSI